jgi:hypothetical protein
VHILQAAQDLVEKVLDELLLERPRGQEAVQVGAEEFGDEVDVLEWRDEDIRKGDDLGSTLAHIPIHHAPHNCQL